MCVSVLVVSSLLRVQLIPMDCSPLHSSVHGILQTNILEWVAMPSFRGSCWPSDWTQVSCIADRFFTFWATRETPFVVKVKVAQSCLTLCYPMEYTVHGILQARILEWVAFPFSRGSSQPRDRTQVSCIVGEFFTSWATREASYILLLLLLLSRFSRIRFCATP